MGQYRQLILYSLILHLAKNVLSSKADICCESNADYSVICPGQNYQAIPSDCKLTIETFNLSNNNISSINFSDAKRYAMIKDLDLSNNAIQSTENIRPIHSFKALEQLDISDNDFYNFDLSIFTMNRHLKVLKVDNNPHIFLKEECASLSLQWFSLNGCNLEYIPTKLLRCLRNLQYLDIRNNHLQNLPSNIKDILPKSKTLLISNNPLDVTALEIFVIMKSDLNVAVQKEDSFDKRSVDGNSDPVLVYVGIILAFAILALAVVITMVLIHCRNM